MDGPPGMYAHMALYGHIKANISMSSKRNVKVMVFPKTPNLNAVLIVALQCSTGGFLSELLCCSKELTNVCHFTCIPLYSSPSRIMLCVNVCMYVNEFLLWCEYFPIVLSCWPLLLLLLSWISSYFTTSFSAQRENSNCRRRRRSLLFRSRQLWS